MKKLILLLTLGLFSTLSYSQKYNLNAPIPTDTSIIKEVLDNGLTIYVKENKMPENRVEMRLVVNAGSIQEDEDQLGLAHFLEHMCFNGTKNFEKDELVDFLEETGVKFGPDLNAYTSFDETVYYFQIPSERSTLIDTGIMVLSDWAQNATLDHEEIDKERGVVLEEWRLHLGADDRMMKVWLPKALQGSRYGERLPIGDTNIIKHCDYETVKRFYKDWYRPDLMAVIVAGDINKYEIAKKLKEQFSKLPVTENAREREYYEIPNNKDPLVSIVTDKEAPYIQLQLFYKHDKSPEGTIGVYMQSILHQLYNGMMGKRLSEILQSPESPFLYAATQYSSFLGRTKDGYMSFSVSKDNQIEESFKRMLIENQRVKKYGFTKGELERQKLEIITSYEKALKELGKTNTKAYTNEFTRNYLENEPIPGIQQEYEYVKHFLPQIELSQINKLAEKWIIDSNLVVIITGPEKDRLKYPKAEDITKIIKDTENTNIDGYVDSVDDTPLLAKKPKKGSIKSEKHIDKLDYDILELSNGAKVVIKSTDFKNDEIIFKGFSYGGESMYGVEDIYSAKFADVITRISGVGETDYVSLGKKMAGSTANISFAINDYDEVVSGNCSPKDIEDLLKLNYLYFTQSRKDQKSFDAFKSRIENQIKFLKSDPGSVFGDTISKVITLNDPRHINILEKKHIDQINIERTHEIFKDRFSNASDFIFLFVGNISKEELKEHLETYIASIPATKSKEKWNNIDPDFPEGITELNFYMGIDPKAQVYMFINGEIKWDKNERLYLNFLSKAVSIRLRKKIREDEGGTYGVRVSVGASEIPEPEYSLTIGFGCNPENTDTLYNIALQELRSIIKDGPSEEELEKAKQIYIRERETDLRTNGFWVSAIQNKEVKDEDILLLDEYKKVISAVTVSDIQKAAEKYIKLDNYVHAVMRPESYKPE